MLRVLVDTAVPINLAFFLETEGRTRSIDSSAGAAVEALVLYDEALVDGASYSVLGGDSADPSRFTEFYHRDFQTIRNRLRDLTRFWSVIPVDPDQSTALYAEAVDQLDRALAPIPDITELRAFELFDRLPYHLGEDPTAIECDVRGSTASDLEAVIAEFPPAIAAHITRFAALLRARSYPTRAAWVLPLLRFVYYQLAQRRLRASYVPHVTKAILAFGLPDEPVESRRLPEYCDPLVRSEFVRRTGAAFGGLAVEVPLPPLRSAVLKGVRGWPDLLDRVARLRSSREAANFRRAFENLLRHCSASAVGARSSESAVRDAVAAVGAEAQTWARTFNSPAGGTRILVTLPLFGEEADGVNFMLVHDPHQERQF